MKTTRGDDKTKPPARERGTHLPGGAAVVFEDADIIVVDKPSGILTASAPGINSPSIFGLLKEREKTMTPRARTRSAPHAGRRVWIVHRLDKEASGLLVFARSDRAFASLKEAFRAKMKGYTDLWITGSREILQIV